MIDPASSEIRFQLNTDRRKPLFLEPQFEYQNRYRGAYAWELGLGIAYQKRRFRLDDHRNPSGRPRSVAPGNGDPNRDGVGQETSVPIYVRARWAPSKTAFVDVYGGVTVGGEVRLEMPGRVLRREHG